MSKFELVLRVNGGDKIKHVTRQDNRKAAKEKMSRVYPGRELTFVSIDVVEPLTL